MNIRGLIFCIIFNLYYKYVSSNEYTVPETTDGYKTSGEYPKINQYTGNPSTVFQGNFDTCSEDDFACLAMAQKDRLGLEAIKQLHKQLDDDKDGTIDLSESDDFLKEELKYNSGAEKRQKNFHRNDDYHISVKDLWEAWLKSEVHNWTVVQTTDWLTSCVELPQYVPKFIEHKVTGANLPRLAVNNAAYLNVLGIKDPIHKQKIALKAMDVVLFGPPKDVPHWKDLMLIFLIIVGVTVIWYAYQLKKKFRNHLNRMNRDMDSLQNAERALQNLQKELEEAKVAEESVKTEKKVLEKKLQDSKSELNSIPSSYSDLEVTQLKAEIEMLRTELQLAEGELKDRCWTPPVALQQWLQLTHEIENKSYLKKKIQAEKQLQQAREACEKLRKKRSSLVGAFVSTHGKSIDEVDRSIVEARTALNEVTHELQERVHRWKQIEMLCGFNIMNNSGFNFLENVLYRNANGRGSSLKGRMSSTDDLDDDTGSIYSASAGYHGKDGDSSSSETSKQEEENACASESKGGSRNNIHFTLGDEGIEDISYPSRHTNKLSASHSKSVSHGQLNLATINLSTKFQVTKSATSDVSALGTKSKSQSEPSLEGTKLRTAIRQMTIQEQPTSSMEEDICSTDSSMIDEEIKKKKRKLNFFSKKSKNKGD
ncbi:stromal interaction molecule homolog [Diorhabda carinulata]|uniref:stromal interaction molecule homolog n=1 Tax=Diorhabda carinulata TaxID=1163345 RepID=UPI0025A2FFB2|nr:stromal interaction molecule homolog [Diorhabda carinulata]